MFLLWCLFSTFCTHRSRVRSLRSLLLLKISLERSSKEAKNTFLLLLAVSRPSFPTLLLLTSKSRLAYHLILRTVFLMKLTLGSSISDAMVLTIFLAIETPAPFCCQDSLVIADCRLMTELGGVSGAKLTPGIKL